MGYSNKLFVLLLILCSCKDAVNTQLVTKCDTACFTAGSSLKGVCKAGVWVCVDNDETTAVCTGQIGPSRESCDGLDNDCDGVVDNDAMGSFKACDTACGKGYTACRDASMVCVGRTPIAEVCDGIDNDCDGFVDELSDLEAKPCYTGDPKQLGYGSCSFGVTRCVNGHNVCMGEKLPQVEVCDGTDNDCDGQIDDGVQNDEKLDLVFFIDNSRSMSSSIDKIKGAIQNLAVKYPQDALKWAIVGVPHVDGSRIKLHSNFTGPNEFIKAMGEQTGDSDNSTEDTYDALYNVCAAFNPMGLTWRNGASRVLVMVTDEDPQSHDGNTFDIVAQTCKNNELIVLGTPNWIELSGTNFTLKMVWSETQTTIETLLDEKLKNYLCK